MTHIASKLLATAALAAAALGLASSAHAAWTFTANSSNQAVVANDGATASIGISKAGFAVTNNSNNAGFASGAQWAATALTYYPGIGMSSGSDSGAPTHAMDNNGNTEAVLFGFTSSVVLSSIGLSYTHNGTTEGASVDLSVFRYVGTGTPTLAGVVPTAMSGWELVSNYGDMQQSNTNAINANNLGSSWWLVSAYNSGFGGNTGSNLDNGNDYFKIGSLNGSACTSTANGVCSSPRGEVPEPASLALVGAALLGVYGTRRRQAAKAA